MKFAMTPRYRHVAISVPDLEEAERYYGRLFDMEVITREALLPDGDRQLPPDKSWTDARHAGIDLHMVALRRGTFVLALFDETSSALEQPTAGRRPLFIGLVMNAAEIEHVRARLEDTERWDDDSGGFRDRYGITWQPSSSDRFAGSGEIFGRWITV